MSVESRTKTVPLTWNWGRQVGTAVITETVDDEGTLLAKVTHMEITDEQAKTDLARGEIGALSIGEPPVAGSTTEQ